MELHAFPKRKYLIAGLECVSAARHSLGDATVSRLVAATVCFLLRVVRGGSGRRRAAENRAGRDELVAGPGTLLAFYMIVCTVQSGVAQVKSISVMIH